jgi:hypothetical protein
MFEDGIDEKQLAQLLSRGFPRELSERCLASEPGAPIDKAVEWLTKQMEQVRAPRLALPLPPPPPLSPVLAAGQPGVSSGCLGLLSAREEERGFLILSSGNSPPHEGSLQLGWLASLWLGSLPLVLLDMLPLRAGGWKYCARSERSHPRPNARSSFSTGTVI